MNSPALSAVAMVRRHDGEASTIRILNDPSFRSDSVRALAVDMAFDLWCVNFDPASQPAVQTRSSLRR
jgi:hypothetical protein